MVEYRNAHPLSVNLFLRKNILENMDMKRHFCPYNMTSEEGIIVDASALNWHLCALEKKISMWPHD